MDLPILDKLEQIAEQLYTVGKVYNVINIRSFIKLLSKGVEDLTKDLIEYAVELYIGPNRDTETDKEESK